MKFFKSPISSIASFLLAGAMVISQLRSAGETNWIVIALAALTATLGALLNDKDFLGQHKWTSYIGYLQLIVIAFSEAFSDGRIDWIKLSISILMALGLRGAADGTKK